MKEQATAAVAQNDKRYCNEKKDKDFFKSALEINFMNEQDEKKKKLVENS